jgi:hypothetical protein
LAEALGSEQSDIEELMVDAGAKVGTEAGQDVLGVD